MLFKVLPRHGLDDPFEFGVFWIRIPEKGSQSSLVLIKSKLRDNATCVNYAITQSRDFYLWLKSTFVPERAVKIQGKSIMTNCENLCVLTEHFEA